MHNIDNDSENKECKDNIYNTKSYKIKSNNNREYKNNKYNTIKYKFKSNNNKEFKEYKDINYKS